MLLNKILSSSFRVFSDDLFEGGHDAGEQFGLLSAFGEHAPMPSGARSSVIAVELRWHF